MSQRGMYAIVGMKFRPPAQGILDALPYAFPFILEREPSNVYDSNAIKVIVASSVDWMAIDEQIASEKVAGFGFSREDVASALPFQIGYIPRESAAEIAPLVDERNITRWNGLLAFSTSGQPRVQFSMPERNAD